MRSIDEALWELGQLRAGELVTKRVGVRDREQAHPNRQDAEAPGAGVLTWRRGSVRWGRRGYMDNQPYVQG